jgi:hypothetical protein
MLQIPALPQLQYLQLEVKPQPSNLREQPLLLRQLGSVTELHLEGIAVQERDELPPQLQKLEAHDIISVEPLCSLTRLTELRVSHTTTPGPQLQRLGQSLRNLCSVDLTYDEYDHISSSAAGWLALPLKTLDIDMHYTAMDEIGRSTLACLAGATKLTGLFITNCELVATARWELAQVICKLTGLQSLVLVELQFSATQEEEEAAAAAAAAVEATAEPAVVAAAGQPAMPDVVGWSAILHAAAGLLQLHSLSIDVPLGAAAAAQLATQLQQLAIYGNSIEEENWEQDSPSELQLINVICSMPWLRALRLDYQPHLSDTAMHVIGLTQLTSLSLDGCSCITDAGLKHLTGLHQLKHLSLTGAAATTSAAHALLPCVSVSSR